MEQQSSNRKTIMMENLLGRKILTANIVDIEWERIIMHLTIEVNASDAFDPSIPLDFYLVASFYKANAKFKIDSIEGNTYKISLNVSNAGYCLAVPTGTYSIYICQGDNILCNPEITGELAPQLEDKSRTFLHNNKTKGYCVNFSCNEDEENLGIVLNIMDMSKSGLRVFNSDDRPVANQSPKKKKLQRKYNNLRRTVIRYLYILFHHYYRRFHKNDKTILFMSEQSETLGSNMMSVANRCVERGMDKEFNIIYSGRATVANPHYGIMSWVETMRKMAQANMIFIDDHAPCLDWIFLYDDTTLVQLWHAGAGFKSSGYSRWGHTGAPAPYGCHRQYKYGIAGSRNIAHFFSEVWGINTEQVLPTGMPRMDEFNDPEYRKVKEAELREKYPLINGKKVIIFAPTYRGKNHFDAHYPYNLIDFDRLYKFCGDEYVVLFKMHPWVSEPVPIKEEYKDKFVDVNLYPNINDLFYISDLLVTDYSSNIFEFSLMRKPMIFFAFDEIQYSFQRGFHRDYKESAPGKVCHTFDEVMTALETGDFEYEKVEEYVEHHFDYVDSGASDRVIDWIIYGNIPEDIKASLKQIDADNARLRKMSFISIAPEDEEVTE